MSTSTRPAIGSQCSLPDGGTVTVTEVIEGIEHGDPVWYVTGTTSLGTTITRWIRRPYPRLDPEVSGGRFVDRPDFETGVSGLGF